MINIGDKLPPFEALDQNGHLFKSQILKGFCSVLFFYSKDEVPITVEEFKDLQSILVGIHSSKQIKDQSDLNIILLSDPKLFKSFGVLSGESTYVFDPEGVLRWMENPVQVEGHSERVLEAVKEFCK